MGRYWVSTKDGDRYGFDLARRHYSAEKNKRPKIRQFVGPGFKLVLLGFMCRAVFAWRKFIDDSGQVGVNCSIFRNESEHQSSDMIREAMEFAFDKWPDERRLYTFVNPKKVKSRNPGYCFLCAGWRKCGTTKSGLIVLEYCR